MPSMTKLDDAPRRLQKRIAGTNITVQKDALDGVHDACQALLHTIAGDDMAELTWFHRALRPDRHLIHPAESFLQGIKELRPAAAFHTFDTRRSKLRRLAKQQKDALRAMARRQSEVAPTAAMRAAVNPHRVPRTGGHAPAEEVRLLSGGQAKRRAAKKAVGGRSCRDTRGVGGDGSRSGAYFSKWRKTKAKKIGKSL